MQNCMYNGSEVTSATISGNNTRTIKIPSLIWPLAKVVVTKWCAPYTNHCEEDYTNMDRQPAAGTALQSSMVEIFSAALQLAMEKISSLHCSWTCSPQIQCTSRDIPHWTFNLKRPICVVITPIKGLANNIVHLLCCFFTIKTPPLHEAAIDSMIY